MVSICYDLACSCTRVDSFFRSPEGFLRNSRCKIHGDEAQAVDNVVRTYVEQTLAGKKFSLRPADDDLPPPMFVYDFALTPGDIRRDLNALLYGAGLKTRFDVSFDPNVGEIRLSQRW